MLIEAINPPRESEPVSPIKTLALNVLKSKNPIIPPASETLKSDRFLYSSVFA